MRHAVAPTLLSLCLRASLLGLASGPLLAQAAGQPFRIAAGPLEQALNSFASQAGILLSYDPQLSQGRQAPPCMATTPSPMVWPSCSPAVACVQYAVPTAVTIWSWPPNKASCNCKVSA